MFDIGFSEIFLIAVVALIVIGPERLPAVARTLGHVFGRMQRYVNDVKADIQREMELDELKKLRTDVEESARSIEESARSFEHSLTKEVSAAQDGLRDLQALANPTAETEPRPAEKSTPKEQSAQPAGEESAATSPVKGIS